MKALPQIALQAIAQHDYDVYVSKGGHNRTRFYNWLLPSGRNMRVHTVAVKTSVRRGEGIPVRDGATGRTLAEVFGGTIGDPEYKVVRNPGMVLDRGICVKEVVRASVDGTQINVTDLAMSAMSGYVVDWSPEKQGRKRYWSYRGKWSHDDYSPRGKWVLWCGVVNPEALKAHKCYQYCAWEPNCGRILPWLKAYVQHPRIELLAKGGIGWLGTRTGFVKQLEHNKPLAKFVMANMEELKRHGGYGVDVIRKAFKDRISLDAAYEKIDNRRLARIEGIPAAVDYGRAAKYATWGRTQGLSHYAQYLQDCESLGLDLADTKNAFPKQFKKRAKIVRDQVIAIKRREDAKIARQQDAAIAAVAAKYAKTETRKGSFRLLLPRKPADVMRDGKRLGICLRESHWAVSYLDRVARGKTVLAFVCRSGHPQSPLAAVEWDLEKNEALQCYGAKNARPPAPVLQFVNRVFKRLGAPKSHKVA